MKRIHRAAIAGAFCLALSPLQAHAYSALYIFGDSLSDVGNDFIGSTILGAPEPAPPYVNGEFSNGPIWVQGLSQSLGLGPVTPSLAGGNDYAFGGATTGYSATVSPTVPVPTLTTQVGLFLAAVPAAPSSALYSVWIGSNDVFNIVSNGTAPALAVQQAQGAAQTEASAIANLASAGAKNFLVPLLGDLGKTPTLNGNPTASAAGTALALIYDAALQADLAGLSSTPGVDVTYLDTLTLLDSAIADPAAYGLTNVTDACYTGTYFGGGPVCVNPNQYLFWDQLHPSETGQQIIAQAAIDAVPEPATTSVLAVGLAGLTMLRRRSRQQQPVITR